MSRRKNGELTRDEREQITTTARELGLPFDSTPENVVLECKRIIQDFQDQVSDYLSSIDNQFATLFVDSHAYIAKQFATILQNPYLERNTSKTTYSLVTMMNEMSNLYLSALQKNQNNTEFNNIGVLKMIEDFLYIYIRGVQRHIVDHNTHNKLKLPSTLDELREWRS